ncbi:MAG: glycerol-3-phosphate responsive antiterminator [Bacillaceae bacterium]
MFDNQQVLPAARNMRDIDILTKSNYEHIVILDIHIGHLSSVMNLAKSRGKKIILHMDLIHGIQSDSYGTEYICQQFKPFGIMSTKANVLLKAKQNGVVVIQRIFLIDSSSLEKSYTLLEKTKPDAIEILPGVMSFLINEIEEKVKVPILAGGFIRTKEDIANALEAGVTAITTSNPKLWEVGR